MDIQKVLFVTKFEELWFDALESLIDLRQASLNHVVFLNVIQREKVALRRGKGYEKKEEVRLREMAVKRRKVLNKPMMGCTLHTDESTISARRKEESRGVY